MGPRKELVVRHVKHTCIFYRRAFKDCVEVHEHCVHEREGHHSPCCAHCGFVSQCKYVCARVQAFVAKDKFNRFLYRDWLNKWKGEKK